MTPLEASSVDPSLAVDASLSAQAVSAPPGMTPEMIAFMQSMISAGVKAQLVPLQKEIIRLSESNENLQKTVEKASKLVKNQDVMIKEQIVRIGNLEKDVSSLKSAHLSDLNNQIQELPENAREFCNKLEQSLNNKIAAIRVIASGDVDPSVTKTSIASSVALVLPGGGLAKAGAVAGAQRMVKWDAQKVMKWFDNKMHSETFTKSSALEVTKNLLNNGKISEAIRSGTSTYTHKIVFHMKNSSNHIPDTAEHRIKDVITAIEPKLKPTPTKKPDLLFTSLASDAHFASIFKKDTTYVPAGPPTRFFTSASPADSTTDVDSSARNTPFADDEATPRSTPQSLRVIHSPTSPSFSLTPSPYPEASYEEEEDHHISSDMFALK